MPFESLTIRVNGTVHVIEADPKTPLIYILRNDLGLNGPKFGCGLGECGACMVLIDKRAARSCIVSLGAATSRVVTTLEGLGTVDAPHPVQSAFIAESAAQCGYCLNGVIMSVAALLNQAAAPSDAELRSSLRYNLCRCGTHIEILRAARAALASKSGVAPIDAALRLRTRWKPTPIVPDLNVPEAALRANPATPRRLLDRATSIGR